MQAFVLQTFDAGGFAVVAGGAPVVGFEGLLGDAGVCLPLPPTAPAIVLMTLLAAFTVPGLILGCCAMTAAGLVLVCLVLVDFLVVVALAAGLVVVPAAVLWALAGWRQTAASSSSSSSSHTVGRADELDMVGGILQQHGMGGHQGHQGKGRGCVVT